MKFSFSFLLILTFIISSCSSYYSTTNGDRSIANEVIAPLDVEELLTFKSTAVTSQVQDLTYNLKNQLYYLFPLDIIEDPKMDSSIAYKIVPVVENQQYRVKIYHSVNAKFDQDASTEVSRFLRQVFERQFPSNLSIFELYYNAKSQDFTSLQVLAKLRRSALAETFTTNFPEGTFQERIPEYLPYWDDIVEKFAKQERAYNKKVKVQREERKAVMDILDKVSEDKQFRNLVAKNDRKGAADLIRSYLPWEEMPPFEKLFWETHLKVMADPLPLEDRILIYRGIDDDIIQTAQDAGKTLTKEEAIKEQKIFLMSTMMTKNQGTWNRRLRSLNAMYDKFMGTNQAGKSSEYTRATRITNMFKKHSKDPKGSPFLSYTPKFGVANGFGSKRNTAYFIDPRMLYFNFASGYETEVEFLLPIASFPDDLAGVYDRSIHNIAGNAEQLLHEQAIAKLEKELGPGKGADAFKRIQLNSISYFKPVYHGGGTVQSAALPEGQFIGLFKSLLGVPTKQAAEVLNGQNDMPCTDLIQLFWK
ncbi:hypothetical protein SHI21_08900 [Bacteriovorax sp. PP10]|uniref:Lipoprotein n=1 Tax=Bacteriovorax antarcticus TaxID=3088717 RepID=A0ABU5VV87_9BACT|nr:hypothetical protein [Bacteriovorax sp. PP10]MEA9356318.1 hypothetical protein [Bacteriovorax sp. PP10]